MIQILKKADQFNTRIFDGNLIVNKPVATRTKESVKPYSNLFYWSHGNAVDDCEFGLHPHEGFEIMTFILEGNVSHFDTSSKVWTPLTTGDFQIIQSNSGIQHQERISKGTRSFQIWFDPNFYEAIKLPPAYVDYHSKDFEPILENAILTTTYIGKTSKAVVQTPHLTIQKHRFDSQSNTTLPLEKDSSYTFYVLHGHGTVDNQHIEKDDAIRISDAQVLELNFQGELFVIKTPATLDYKAIWS